MAHFSEIVLPQAEKRRSIEFRVPAHVVVRVGMKRLSIGVAPDLFRLVLPLDVHRPGIPVVLLPRHVIAALQEEDFLARTGDPVREGPAAGPGADDDDVVPPVRHTGTDATDELRVSRSFARSSMRRTARAVHPVWWLAPTPRPVSPWKYS
jgi:hypothetical protein